jgi:hypothetical protein
VDGESRLLLAEFMDSTRLARQLPGEYQSRGGEIHPRVGTGTKEVDVDSFERM